MGLMKQIYVDSADVPIMSKLKPDRFHSTWPVQTPYSMEMPIIYIIERSALHLFRQNRVKPPAT